MSKIFGLIKKYREMISYVIVGVLTTVVSFLVQWVFKDVIPINAGIATLIAWFCSVLFAFFANKIFVFESKGKQRFFKELLMFYASRMFTGLLEVGAMLIFVERLALSYWGVKIIANVVILILNYVLSKFIVFKKNKGK